MYTPQKHISKTSWSTFWDWTHGLDFMICVIGSLCGVSVWWIEQQGSYLAVEDSLIQRLGWKAAFNQGAADFCQWRSEEADSTSIPHGFKCTYSGTRKKKGSDRRKQHFKLWKPLKFVCHKAIEALRVTPFVACFQLACRIHQRPLILQSSNELKQDTN